MDIASILLVLAAAGQTGWTPERSAAPPPASAPTYDRYALPPASGVAPPPSVIDRTRSAITESGTTVRDGLEAGIEAASQHLQGWTGGVGRQLQTTGNSLRTATEQTLGVGSNSPPQVSNPFVTAPAAPATTPRTRGGLAPPPWAEPPSTTAPDWNADSSEAGAAFRNELPPLDGEGRGGVSPAGRLHSSPTTRALQPMQRDSGWTSIGSNIAAPPLLVPALTTPARTQPPLPIAAASSGPSLMPPAVRREPIHSVLGDSSPQNAPPAGGADNWATGWGASAPSAATISRSAAANSSVDTPADTGRDAVQPMSTAPPVSQPQATNNWANLWGDKDPWAEPQHTPRSAAPANKAPTDANANNTASQPVVVPPATIGNPPVANAGAVQTVPIASPAVSTASSYAAADQPPWLPLLVVSLSLAGSLGANLFLGWSYIDARQKYRTLVRKTADKFRRAAA